MIFVMVMVLCIGRISTAGKEYIKNSIRYKLVAYERIKERNSRRKVIADVPTRVQEVRKC